MAHFLSDATHDRLFHRLEPVSTASQSRAGSSAGAGDGAASSADVAGGGATAAGSGSSVSPPGTSGFRAPSSAPTGAVTIPISGPGAGLFRSAAFEGPIRCAAVCQTVKHGHAPVVWCGDLEGTLSLRNASSGEVYQVLEQRERSVFAYAICFVPNDEGGGDLWVGFSDGYLCVLDADNGAKKYEARAHGGALYAMQYHAITHRVYTAGADWQINAWNAAKMCRAPAPSQMSGHQNGVRSLCFGVAGNSMILYSGGDDMSIRAWDVTRHQQLMGGWPALGHRGGVHALACTGQLLFSGSTDGSIRVWSAAFGEPIGVVEQRAHTPVNSLCFDEANNAVWAGGIDGIIRVWDATDLSLRAELNEHHATHAPLAMAVSRLVACKVWLQTKDGILVHYVDTDGAVGGGDAIENTRLAEIECINDVDRRRRKVIECDIELNELRQEGEAAQEKERKRKLYTVHAMHRGHDRALQQQALCDIATFVDKRRRMRVQTAEANAFATRQACVVLRQYWAKWLRHHDERDVERRQDTAAGTADLVRHDRQRALHANVLLEAARRSHLATTKAALGNALATLNKRVWFNSVVQRWYAYAKRHQWERRERTGREAFAAAAAGHLNRKTAAWAYDRLNTAVYCVQTRRMAMAQAAMMNRARLEDLRRRYFLKWMGAAQYSVRAMAEQRLANLRAETERIRDECREQGRDESRRDLDRMEAARRAYEAHMKELEDHRKHINDVEGVSEDELNAAILEKERNVALIQAETRREQLALEELRRQKRAVQRELLRDASLDTSKPVLDQLEQAIYLVKARGVNVKQDQVAIAHARDLCAKKPSTAVADPADKVYQDGLNHLREVFTEAVRPHNLTEYDAPLHWMVSGALDKFHDRQMTKAASALATLVTAYDFLHVGQTGKAWVTDDEKSGREVFKPTHKHHEEVILNFGPLLDLAIRIHKWRRGELQVREAPAPASPAKAGSGKSASPARSGASPRSATAPRGGPASKTAPRAGGGAKAGPPARATTPSPAKAGAKAPARAAAKSPAARGRK